MTEEFKKLFEKASEPLYNTTAPLQTLIMTNYYNVLYSYINLTILDFLYGVEIAFFLFFLSSYVGISASGLMLTCILFMLMLTSCLAPLHVASMIIAGS